MDDKHSGSQSKNFPIQPSPCNNTKLPKERDDLNLNERFFHPSSNQSCKFKCKPEAGTKLPYYQTSDKTPNPQLNFCVGIKLQHKAWGSKIIRAGHYKRFNTVAGRQDSFKFPHRSLCGGDYYVYITNMRKKMFWWHTAKPSKLNSIPTSPNQPSNKLTRLNSSMSIPVTSTITPRLGTRNFTIRLAATIREDRTYQVFAPCSEIGSTRRLESKSVSRN